MTAYHPLVKQLLDGDLTLAQLPPDLQAEGAAALRLLASLDRAPIALSPALDDRVMAAVRIRAASPWRRMIHWMSAPRELRLRVRPWVIGAGLAAAAGLVLLLAHPFTPRAALAPVATAAAAPESAFVRFVLYAPGARQVGLAGTFNHWDQSATPLARAGQDGVWTVTIPLPAGQHQYAFVVDGRRWVADPAAPGVDDGFGRRNSLIAVGGPGGHSL
jgi:AMP-activated protein kinase-like protein